MKQKNIDRKGKRYRLVTLTYKQDGYKYTITQNLSVEFRMGHYYWVLTDSKGNICSSGGSTCAPKVALDQEQVSELAEDALNWYRQHLDFERKEDVKA